MARFRFRVSFKWHCGDTMKVLFTGSSSFTGYWFVRSLIERGHEVVATFQGQAHNYSGIRGARVEKLQKICQCAFGLVFGSEPFLDCIQANGPFDVLCHHAADVTNYKSSDFDPVAALKSNSHELTAVMGQLEEQGCFRLVLTGSVFEQNEGVGSDPNLAFSPYGLSKGLTSDLVRYYCGTRAWSMGKFVIPNPFGPFEEPRFTHFLVKNWAEGKAPEIRTPDYVRDNIHISLLAKSYAHFVDGLAKGTRFVHRAPSGYVESQGAFALRFAAAMRPRLGFSCDVELARQTDFAEPRMRINTEPAVAESLDWNEEAAWDALADYYQGILAAR